MEFFHRTYEFNLQVYDQALWDLLTGFENKAAYPFLVILRGASSANSSEDLSKWSLFEERKNRIEQLVAQQRINKEWLDYVNWLEKNYKRIRAHALFRGIAPEYYDDQVKYGISTASLKDPITAFGKEYEKYSCSEVIWAWTLEKAVEYIERKSPMILVIYDESYFAPLTGRLSDYAWIRKDHRTDFRDTVIATIKVTKR